MITSYSSVVRRIVTVTVLTSICAFSVSTAQAADKLDAVLRLRSRQLMGQSRVIVEFKGNTDVRVITQRGGVAGRQLEGRASQVADLDNRSLEALAQDARVARVTVDHAAFATLERTGAAVGAALAREQFELTGKGIGIAVIDSGITTWHDDLYLSRAGAPRLTGRVVHFKDFTRPSRGGGWASEVPSDDYGHGTHVAGIIAGSGFDSGGRRSGMAPGANLIGLKVLDGDGHGYISDVIAAIDYAIAVRRTYNIRVINLSVASGVFESYRSDPLAMAAHRAVDAGIVVVASAGNLGAGADGRPQFGGITSPGNAPWVLTVGASSHAGTPARHDDSLAGFSSRGPSWIDFAAKPDLVAPGVGIESLSDPNSTLYAANPGYRLEGTRRLGYKPYLSLSGTSMAAPVVAGAIALMLEANPSLTPNAIKAILEYTAGDVTHTPYLAQGAGLMNVRGAVRMARFFANPRRGVGRTADRLEGEWIEWSRHLAWGNDLVAGGVPLPGSNAWSTRVEWGARATNTGQRVVLGAANEDNIVWSTGADDNIVWSTSSDDNIVWSTSTDDNIVWSTGSDDNIVWSTGTAENVVWGLDCGGANCHRVLWGAARGDGSTWGTASDDNIVWSTSSDDNIVWSTSTDDNIVWSTSADDNIVWSTGTVDQTLWPAMPVDDNPRRTLPGRD